MLVWARFGCTAGVCNGLYLVQRCLWDCYVCAWVTAVTAFLRYDKSYPHCFLSSNTVNLFFLALFLALFSTQLPAERSSSPQKTQRLICVLFPQSQCVSTWLFMLKSKTNYKMSSPFLPLLKSFCVSLLPTFGLKHIFSVELFCLSSVYLVLFYLLCNTPPSISSFASGFMRYTVLFCLSLLVPFHLSFFHSE